MRAGPLAGPRPLHCSRRSCPQLAQQQAPAHQQLLHHSSSRLLRPAAAARSPERLAEWAPARSPERLQSRAVTPGRVMKRVLSVERRVALSARRPGEVEELAEGLGAEPPALLRSLSTPRGHLRQLSRPPSVGQDGHMAAVTRLLFASGTDTPTLRRAGERPPLFAPHPGVQHFCLSPAGEQQLPQQHPHGDTAPQEPPGKVFEFFSAGESPSTPRRSCGSPCLSVGPAGQPSDLFTEVRRRMSMASRSCVEPTSSRSRIEPAVVSHYGQPSCRIAASRRVASSPSTPSSSSRIEPAVVSRCSPEVLSEPLDESAKNAGYVSDGAANADQNKTRERKNRHRRTVSLGDYGSPLQRRVSLGRSLQSTFERGSARLRSMEMIMDSSLWHQQLVASAASNVLESTTTGQVPPSCDISLREALPESTLRRTSPICGEREVVSEEQLLPCAPLPSDVSLTIEAPDLGGSLYPDVSLMVVRAAMTPTSVSEDVEVLPSPGTPMVCGMHDEVPVEVQRFLWGSMADGLNLPVKPMFVPEGVQSLPMLRRYEVARRPRAIRCHVEVPHAMPFVQACN